MIRSQSWIREINCFTKSTMQTITFMKINNLHYMDNQDHGDTQGTGQSRNNFTLLRKIIPHVNWITKITVKLIVK